MSTVGEGMARDAGVAQVTSAMQDYLKAVYYLRDESGVTTVQSLAGELRVSSPSVTNMVKRLAALGLLRHLPYQGVALTDAGERVAVEVTRHHRLLEQFLVESLGYGWDEVHAEAERLEHHISEELEARIAASLGHPERDPHGDPIPSREGMIATVADACLLDLKVGERAAVTRVSDRDSEQLRYLGALGLHPGVDVTVLEQYPFEGPLRLRVGDAEHVIGRPLAAAVRVIGRGSGSLVVGESRSRGP